MTIELNEQQQADYLAGKSINVVPHKPTKWEPTIGNSFHITVSGSIEWSFATAYAVRKYGLAFPTRELAEQYLPMYKRQHLILNWLSEQPDQSDGDYEVFLSDGVWCLDMSNYSQPSIGSITMNYTNATELCRLLNNNLIEF